VTNKSNITQWKAIAITTLIAGILDLTAACIHAWIINGTIPNQLLAYIASGVWGNSAFHDGFMILFVGLIFHFLIVFACVFCFFWIFPRWTLFQHSLILNAFFIGIVAWLITTQIVVRFSKIPSQEFNFSNALISISILIVCIGFPIAYAAKKFNES